MSQRFRGPVHGWLRSLMLLALTGALLTGCKEELFAKVDETDANAALNLLYAEGIDAEKVPVDTGSWRVEVDSSDLQRALYATVKQGIPRERFATMGELFKKEGLVSTPAETRMRYLYGISQELSNTLSHIDGVVSARVHPVIPVQDPLADKPQPASAAVFIKYLPDADVQQMAPAIRTLVARSIEGLSVDNVSLTFFASRLPATVPPSVHRGFLAGLGANALAWLLAAALLIALVLLGWQVHRNRRRTAAHVVLSPAGRSVTVR